MDLAHLPAWVWIPLVALFSPLGIGVYLLIGAIRDVWAKLTERTE